MKKFIIFIITFILFTFSGCNVYNNNVDLEKKTMNKDSITENKITPYILKFDHTVTFNELEPENGILLGMYFNRNLYYGIENYQENFSKTPNHYVYEYTLGTEFETNYILDCIARDKTAFIKLIPNKYTIYDLSHIQSVANILSTFNIDTYIELFPNPTEENFTPIKYKEYFENSSKILKTKNSNTSIIFTPSSEELFSSNLFYPSEDSFDFVGFNYIGNIKKNNEEIYPDFFNKFKFVYNTYAFKKPIFITTFALSYFSNNTNTYYVNENINFINTIFEEIKNSYKQVKGVNFYDIDVNELPFEYNIYNVDNFKISENENILRNFNKLIESDLFISKYEPPKKSENKIQYIYDAILVDKTFYVSETILFNENIANMNYPTKDNSYIFEGNIYYPLNYLFDSNNDYNIEIDSLNKIIVIE